MLRGPCLDDAWHGAARDLTWQSSPYIGSLFAFATLPLPEILCRLKHLESYCWVDEFGLLPPWSTIHDSSGFVQLATQVLQRGRGILLLLMLP